MTREELKEHCKRTLLRFCSKNAEDEHRLVLEILEENRKLTSNLRGAYTLIEYMGKKHGVDDCYIGMAMQAAEWLEEYRKKLS